MAHAYQAAEAMGGARLEILEEPGHFLPWRNANWFLAVLEDFLKSTTPARARGALAGAARQRAARRREGIARYLDRELSVRSRSRLMKRLWAVQLAEDAERPGDAAGVRFDRTVELGRSARRHSCGGRRSALSTWHTSSNAGRASGSMD